MVSVRKLSYFVQKHGYGYFTIQNFKIDLPAGMSSTLAFYPAKRDWHVYGVLLAFSANIDAISVDILHDNFKTEGFVLDETALENILETFIEITDKKPLVIKFTNLTSVTQKIKATTGSIVLVDKSLRNRFLKDVERYL